MLVRGNIWLPSIQGEDGAERGEGLRLSTGNADHPSTHPPTKHNLLFGGENGKKEEIPSPGKIEVGASHLPPTALTKADFYADKIRDHLI